jgi:molybdopterin/thiamine biosynthesis adenylyltransferase
MIILNGLKTLSITQIGCGGTGGWLAPHLIKFLSNLHKMLNLEREEQYHKNIIYNLIDPDIVEARNILRQNFIYDDIEDFKVNSIKRRYVGYIKDFNIFKIKLEKINQFNKILNKSTDEENRLDIIIGCIDNIQTRLRIYKWCKKNINPTIYLDAGNELDRGQIISQVFKLDDFINNSSFETFISLENYKKYIKEQDNFNKLFDKNKITTKEASCAYFGDQSQSINNLAAAYLFTIIQNLIVSDKLPPYNLFFNNNGNSISKNFMI